MFGKRLARRLVWMTAHLMSHGMLSFPEYAQLHPLSLRTYRRDIALLGEFGIVTRTIRDHESGRVVFVEARLS